VSRANAFSGTGAAVASARERFLIAEDEAFFLVCISLHKSLPELRLVHSPKLQQQIISYEKSLP
jgi:hypothetical protein